MRRTAWILAVLAAVAVLLVSAACGSGKSSSKRTPTPGASSIAGTTATGTVTPADALQRTEQTLAAGYTITVTASNFLLPQWGGSDSGTVQVGKDGKSAVARLRRTGEDSYYDIRYVDGQTFFKRGTCDTWARVPGGGADVLKPFLLTASHVLTTVQDPKFIEADNRLVADATVDGLGRSLIQMEPKTYELVTIVFGDQPDNAGHRGFTFDFSDVGKPLTVEKPSGDVPDRGPGGAPC